MSDKKEGTNEKVQFLESYLTQVMKSLQENLEDISYIRDMLEEITEEQQTNAYCTVFDYLDLAEGLITKGQTGLINAQEDISAINFDENKCFTDAASYEWKPSATFKHVPKGKKNE